MALTNHWQPSTEWCIWTLNRLQLSDDLTVYHSIGDFLTKKIILHTFWYCCLGLSVWGGPLESEGPGNVFIWPGCSYTACVLIKLYHSPGKQSFGLQDTKLTNKLWLDVLTLFCLIFWLVQQVSVDAIRSVSSQGCSEAKPHTVQLGKGWLWPCRSHQNHNVCMNNPELTTRLLQVQF